MSSLNTLFGSSSKFSTLALNITTATSGNYTIPSGVYQIYLDMQGSGGSGGNGSGDGGGGGGGKFFGILSVNPGDVYAYSFGVGGAPETDGGNAVFGGITAYGGKTGTATGGGAGGAVGSAIGGTAGVGGSGGDGILDCYMCSGGGGGDSGGLARTGGDAGVFIGGTTNSTNYGAGGASASANGASYNGASENGTFGSGGSAGTTGGTGGTGFIRVFI